MSEVPGNRERLISTIKETMKLLDELKARFNIKKNSADSTATLYVGVTETDLIEPMSVVIEKYFGKPYKARGEMAIIGNWFDSFIKNCGGIKSDQVLFRKSLEPGKDLFVAIWPWGSNPVKTSIRIGLICETEEEEAELGKFVKSYFA